MEAGDRVEVVQGNNPDYFSHHVQYLGRRGTVRKVERGFYRIELDSDSYKTVEGTVIHLRAKTLRKLAPIEILVEQVGQDA